MNKILVTVYVLYLENQYDIMIPINLSVKDAIALIQQALLELSDNSFKNDSNAMLYNENGAIINVNNIVKFSGLYNGCKVIFF